MKIFFRHNSGDENIFSLGITLTRDRLAILIFRGDAAIALAMPFVDASRQRKRGDPADVLA